MPARALRADSSIAAGKKHFPFTHVVLKFFQCTHNVRSIYIKFDNHLTYRLFSKKEQYSKSFKKESIFIFL